MKTAVWSCGMFVGVLAVIGGVATQAGAQNACVAGKIKAASQRAVCKSLLEAGEARTNVPAKPTAVAKCESTYDESFAKLEAAGGCATTGDPAAVASDVDDFVAALAAALDVAVPPEPNKCESTKIKAAAKKASCLLRLESAYRAKPHRPPSAFGAVKCSETFVKTFTKLGGDATCNTSGDTQAIGQMVDDFVNGITTLAPPLESACVPVTPVALHGDDPFYGNTRITPIVQGKVPCVHVETLKRASCAFRPDSGDWIETASGNYALLGQWISKTGDPGGDYTVAASVAEDLAVPCIEPSGNDVSGTGTGQALATACTFERFLSARNESGGKLGNVTNRQVCTTSFPHPDQTAEGPVLVECLGDDPQSCCFTGKGAGLNAANGTERDENGIYLPGSSRCHVAVSSGVEVYAAKRPATRVFPPAVDNFTPLVWRPVSPLNIVNY